MNEKLKESSLTINIEESILDDVLNRIKNSRLINDFGKIGRAHVRTPVTSLSRMPSSA